MTRIRILPVIALVLLVGSLQWLATPAEAQGGSTLSGIVCSVDYDGYDDAGSTKPYCRGGVLPGATLTLASGDILLGLGATEKTATSDENGYWAFSGVADGTYTLTVERTGFETLETQVTVPDESYLELSLVGKRVDVTGQVTDAGGAAISGASVTLSGREYQTTKTGTDGRFTASLTAGHYTVQLTHPDFRSLYEDRLLDGASPEAFRMESAPERTATVTGTVHDQDGAPVAGALVEVSQWGYYDYAEETPRPATASGSDGSSGESVANPEPYPYYDGGYQQVTTDASGGFTVKVYAGHVNLNVWKEGYARYYGDFEIADGQTRTEDVELQKFPDKTAHIKGRVTDAESGAGLRWISLYAESPRYGLTECSAYSAEQKQAQADYAPGYYPYGRDCAITVGDDGSFEGDVTPGYTLLRVYYEHWRSCQETQDADGSYTRSCGRDYFQHVQTLDLAADAETRIDVALTPKPGPDAVLSGYVVDKETQTAIAGVRVSISNQDNYGYAWATTDEDGSYRVRIRSGYHQVSVWAEGYLNWEGVVQVPSGDEVPLDILLTPGQNAYGGCCWIYAEDRAVAVGAAESSDASSSGVTRTSAPTAASEETAAQDFEDLGGGLGPYDPEARAEQLAEEARDIPAPGLVVVLASVAAALVAVRRRRPT